MYPECQTSCCSTVNASGCLKYSLRRSLIQSLSAGRKLLIPGLGKMALSRCLGEMHERRDRGVKMQQHPINHSDTLIFPGSSKDIFLVATQSCCC